MQEFAKDNNWQYNQSERTVDDLVPYPPSYSGIVSSWNKVRCTVSGELNDRPFELTHITYMQSAYSMGALSDNTGRGRYAGTSVLRLEGHPKLKKTSDLIYEHDSSYTYIICRYNALHRKDIQAMFASVG